MFVSARDDDFSIFYFASELHKGVVDGLRCALESFFCISITVRFYVHYELIFDGVLAFNDFRVGIIVGFPEHWNFRIGGFFGDFRVNSKL